MAGRKKEDKKELTEEELKALQAQKDAEEAADDATADEDVENTVDEGEAEKAAEGEPKVDVINIDAQIEKRKTVGTDLQAIIRQRIREA